MVEASLQFDQGFVGATNDGNGQIALSIAHNETLLQRWNYKLLQSSLAWNVDSRASASTNRVCIDCMVICKQSVIKYDERTLI